MKLYWRPPAVFFAHSNHKVITGIKSRLREKLRCRGFGQILNSRNIGCCPRGFTLIEVIVAITILSISLVMVMQLFSAGLKASRASCDYTRAVIYAKDIMEEMSGSSESESGKFEDGFFWEIEVTPYEDSEGAIDNLLQIKVKVSWDDVRRKPKSLELVSLRTTESKEEL